MPRETINPKSMYDAVSYGFSHATRSSSRTVIHCAGQVAWDDKGALVGAGDLAAQAAQAFRNLKKVLAEAGAKPADVVRMRTYVVDHSPDKLETIGRAIQEFYAGALPAANTLVGVQCLALPEFLIEIEVTAMVD
jgi:enamine deaminase RidA (YjgF/YER057c/UK114 family)